MQTFDKKRNLSEPGVSVEALALFGLETMAYMRPMRVNGRRVQIICAADGTPLTIAPDRDVALLTIRQHDMEPKSLH